MIGLSNEEQRDSQIANMKPYYQEKDCLFDENRKKLQDMIEEMIEILRKRLSEWTEELERWLDSSTNPESNEILTKIGSSLRSLENTNFRDGNIYDKVDKVKLFNENVLPESRGFCQTAKESIKEFKIDQSKLDACKEEMVELLESIHLNDLVALSKCKRQKASEQLDLLQQKIKSLTVTNEELKDEASMFEAELDAVVASKLKLHKDLEALDLAHKELLEKYAISEFLREDSLIIQGKDINAIRSWIRNPENKSSSFFKLDLLYRATRDGFNSFHKKWENKFPTIIFIKSKDRGIIVKEGGRVFGGYTTKNWRSNGQFIEDKEAFLFSLTHQEKYPIKYPENAINRAPNCIEFGIYDIFIPENCNTKSNQAVSCFPNAYECSKFSGPGAPGANEYLAGSAKFTVEEIEVYQVVWLE